MNLPADFNEAARRIEVLARLVVGHRFDHRERHAFPSKIIQGVADEPATDAASARGAIHREIGDTALERLAIEKRGDEAEDFAVFFGDENARRIGRAVIVDVPSACAVPPSRGCSRMPKRCSTLSSMAVPSNPAMVMRFSSSMSRGWNGRIFMVNAASVLHAEVRWLVQARSAALHPVRDPVHHEIGADAQWAKPVYRGGRVAEDGR